MSQAVDTLRVRPVPRADGRPLQVSVVFMNPSHRRVVRRYTIPADLISRPSTAVVRWAIDRFFADLDRGWADSHRAVSTGWGEDGWWHATVFRSPFPVGATVRTLHPGAGLVYFRGQVVSVGGALEMDPLKWRVTVEIHPDAELPAGAERTVEWIGTPEELHRWVYRP